MHAVVEGQEIDDECYELLKATDSLKPNNEFRQWLHIWNISNANSRDAGHVSSHTSLPWVRVWDKPDLSVMMATYHVTDFVNFPTSWLQLWYHLDEYIEDRRSVSRGGRMHGPYWMLMGKPTIAFLAGKIAEIKRGIGDEMFKEFSSIGDVPHDIWRTEGVRRFKEALEPFRVMSHQQEKEDEAARAAEERSATVSGRGKTGASNRVALGRPPRCR